MEHNHLDITKAPIGVFDSGLGGISVLRALVREMPNENYLYFGDSANAPYGTKTLEEVRKLTVSNVEYLLQKGSKAVVVACNTATSAAVRYLREKYPQEIIIGIEPAIKPATTVCEQPTIIAMATPMTLKEQKFQALVSRYKDIANIIPLPCPGLVEFVEDGKVGTEEFLQFMTKLFAPFQNQRIDAVVLGCTHYPFSVGEIKKVLGDHVKLFDGAWGTARETKRRIAAAGLLNDSEEQGIINYENSAMSNARIAICKRLYELPIDEEEQ